MTKLRLPSPPSEPAQREVRPWLFYIGLIILIAGLVASMRPFYWP